jgi:hypothetical protein
VKARLFEVLNPLGRFSPLNPRHPLHPLRAVVRQRRPPGSVSRRADEESEPSWLARFYGDAVCLDDVPTPNMEWWWQTIELGEMSLITNVHLFAIPLVGLVAQATVVVRQVKTGARRSGEVVEAYSSGVFDPREPASFSAPGFRLGFERDGYRVQVKTSELDVDVTSKLGAVALLGDSGGKPGWYDLNPDGGVPIWASYRSRFGKSKGTIKWGKEATQDVYGTVRFDHQSLHFSARDTRAFSLPILAEYLLLRPQWLWYHARLNHSVNLMVCKVTNGHTGSLMKLSAALCNDDGNTILVDPLSIRISSPDRKTPELRGWVKAPAELNVRFEVGGEAMENEDDWRADWMNRRYDLTLKAARSSSGEVQDWTVRYPIVGPFRYEAQEVPVEVTGQCSQFAQDPRLRTRGEKAPRGTVEVVGTGTQEILDMLGSVTIKA